MITTSIGVAHVAANAQTSLWDMFGDADRALYVAKEAGRNCVMVASAELHEPRTSAAIFAPSGEPSPVHASHPTPAR